MEKTVTRGHGVNGAGMGKTDLAIGVLLFAVAWVTRGLGANAFVTWDEPAWVYRSVHFMAALGRGDWAGTLLVGHPGVVTMWLGTMGLAWHRFVVPTISAADWRTVAALATLNVHDETTIRHLAALLPAAKSFLPLAHGILAAGLWVVLRKLLPRPHALLSASLVILDPYGLALARVLHIDALTSQFMLIACLAAVVYVRTLDQPSRRYLLLAGVATGLAALTKSYGVLAGPVIAVLWLAGWWRRASFDGTGRRPTDQRATTRSWQRVRPALVFWARDVALWAAAAGAVFVLAWPAMWVTPLGVVKGILGLSFEYATRPGDATTAFFRGQVVADPGPWFYPVALWFRATPLALVGMALAVVGLLGVSMRPILSRTVGERATGPSHGAVDTRHEPRRRPALDRGSAAVAVVMLAYALSFLVIITLSRKKFDRYMLPALLAGDVLGGIGLASSVGRLWPGDRRGHAMNRAGIALVGLALVVGQAVALLGPLYPAHYLAYYNPLAGGSRRAAETIPVGWGEGIEQVAHHLADQEGATDTHVATWAVAGVAPFFPGHVAQPDAEGLANADYIVLYVGDQQAGSPLAEGLGEPLFVAHLNGIPYAWLYRSDYDRELGRAIDDAADAGAVIVSNTDSSLPRHKSSALPYYVVSGESEEQVAQALQAAGGDAPYLFYLEFAGAGDDASSLIAQQLAQGALLLWQKPFAYGTLSYYRRPSSARFEAVRADRSAGAIFGEQLRLQSYGLSAGPVQYRQQVGVALSWRATRTPEHDYHIFLRLVDAEGRLWGQRDQPLQDGAGRLPSLWGDGQEHVCRYTVPVDAGTPPGAYWLSIGLYRLDSLARLEILGDDGRSRGTELRLGPFQVVTALEPPTVDDLAITHPLMARLGQGAELLGYDLAEHPYESGEGLPLTLYWRATATLSDYDMVLRLAQGGATLAQTRTAPAGPHHPTERWVPGEVLRYPHRVQVPADLASGDYDLALNWVDARGEPLLAQDLVLSQVRVEYRDRLFVPPAMQHPLNIRAGQSAELLGYDLGSPTGKAGEALPLTLYWRAMGPSKVSYTVFVHLLDAGGAVRGQVDSVPARGERPMTGWLEGEIIVDRYDLPVAADAAPGSHRIEIGVYDPADGARLPLLAADGTPLSDRRLLIEETIQIE